MKIQLAFTALIGFAMTAAAAAVPDEEVAYVIETRPLDDGGVLTVYGIHATSSVPHALQARQCGGDGGVRYVVIYVGLLCTVADSSCSCSSSHTATRATCQSLVSQICNSSANLSSSPRSICFTQNGDQCCVSWSAAPSAHFASFPSTQQQTSWPSSTPSRQTSNS